MRKQHWLIIIVLLLAMGYSYTHQIVRSEEASPEELVSLGNDLLIKGQTDNAIYKYQEAIKIQPKNIDAHIGIGNAYSIQGRYEEAMVEYKKALKSNPRSARVWNIMAYAYMRMAKYKKALQCVNKAIKFKPDLRYNFTKGEIYEAMGDFGKAIAEFKKAENEPNLYDRAQIKINNIQNK